MPEPIEITPDAAQYRTKIMQVSPILIAVLAFAAFKAAGDPWMLVVVIATAGIALLAVWRFFGRARVRLDESGLSYRRMLGEKHLSVTDFGQVVFAPELKFLDPRMDALLSVTDRHGRGQIIMTAPFWTHHDMRRVTAAIDAPVDVMGSCTIRDIQKAHPRALPMYLGRPYLLTALIIGGLLVALAGVAGLAAVMS